MRVVIFGVSGQLGRDLRIHLEGLRGGELGGKRIDVLGFTRQDVDITDTEKVKRIIFDVKPRFVFNAAAWNAVDEAEKVENSARVFLVNSFAPFSMALFSDRVGATFVTISTDYVFDGKKNEPYTEDDPPNPLSVYAISKLMGEILIRNYAKNFIIVRSGGLYGLGGSALSGRNYRNFPERVVENLSQKKTMSVVKDVFSAPTYTWDLARKIVEISLDGFLGLIHIMQKGCISWYDFAVLVAKLAGLDTSLIKPIEQKELKMLAKRPKFSVLANSILEKEGKNDMMTVEDALKKYLVERGILKG